LFAWNQVSRMRGPRSFRNQRPSALHQHFARHHARLGQF
jgi:hypothetical protein